MDEDNKDFDHQIEDMEMSIDDTKHNVPNESITIRKFKQTRNYSKMVQSYLSSDILKLVCKISCIVLVIILVILIYVAIFEIIAAVCTWVGALIIMFLLHFFIFRIFCRFSTFPGAYKMWLREVEFKFCIETSYHILLHIESVKTSIELLTNEHVDRESMNEAINVMHRYNNLTWIQNTTHEKITKLHEMMKKTKISVNGNWITLLDLRIEYAYESDQSNAFQDVCHVKFEDHPRNNYAAGLLQLCAEVIGDLKYICHNNGF